MRRRVAADSAIKTALIYTRVSSDEQEREGLSLPAQLADCRRYASAHGWILGGDFTDVMSGKRDDRPAYQELLARVRQLRAEGQSVVVVVKWLHRLGRRVLERARAWEELDALGVALHSVAEGGQVPKLVADVLAAVAEEESRQIGERTSAAWAHTVSLGWAKTTKKPWGYIWRPATPQERAAGSPKSVLDIDQESAPFARKLFDRMAAGTTIRQLTAWATRLPEPIRGGRAMSRRTLSDILQSPIYAGRPVHGDPDVLSRPTAQWPALVPDLTWQRVQGRFDSNRKLPQQASGDYLLTGLVRCPKCGGRMRGQSYANVRAAAATLALKGAADRYRCGADDKGRLCTGTIWRSRVDALVLEQVSELVSRVVGDAWVQAALERAWHAKQHEEAGDNAAQIAQLEQHIGRARRRITRGTELLVDGTIERQAYDDLVAKARAEAESAEAELASINRVGKRSMPKLPPLAEVLAALGDWKSVLEGADIGAQREVLALLVEQVVPHRVKRGVYHPEITWTPLGQMLRQTTAAL